MPNKKTAVRNPDTPDPTSYATIGEVVIAILQCIITAMSWLEPGDLGYRELGDLGSKIQTTLEKYDRVVKTQKEKWYSGGDGPCDGILADRNRK